MIHDCIFCNFAKNEKDARCKLENTILYEDENFIVTPSAGAIVAGYILIIPKRHINSIAELNEEELTNFLELFSKLSKWEQKIFKTIPVAYEHGSNSAGTGKFSNSINHAHFHIVPVIFDASRHNQILTEREMFKIDFKKEITKYAEKTYLLYFDSESNAYISLKPDMPRQYPRIKVAEQVGKPEEWDWRLFYNEENIRKTIDLWNAYFSKK